MKYLDYSRRKPVFAKKRLELTCDYCAKLFWEARDRAQKKKRHFCSMRCYAQYRKEVMLASEQPSWKGGITPYESHRKYVQKNPERIAHLKARRYAREKNAEGSHTLEEWQELKASFNHKCAKCGETKLLTKDHIRPLSESGSDFISNIQPLCRSCNSRKWKTYIHENSDLLKI
jgi:5-methylcytosine-specific restriction endonuclease McrA